MPRIRRMHALGVLIVPALLALWPAIAAAQEGQAAATSPTASWSDSSAVVGVVTGFHDRLEAGDSAGALALLAPDAQILEGGEVVTRAEYAAHHLASDVAAARAAGGAS